MLQDCTIWGYLLAMLLDGIFGSLVALFIELMSREAIHSPAVGRFIMKLAGTAAIGGLVVKFIDCRGTIIWA